MARYTIYSSNGVAKYTGTPTFYGAYLKTGYLEFREIASPVPIEWEIGDYVEYDRTGLRYRLYAVPQQSVKKQSARGTYGAAFVYRNVQFYDATKILELAPFRDLVPEDNAVHFSTQPSISVFDDVAGIAERIEVCVNTYAAAAGLSGTWRVAVVETSDADLLATLQTELEYTIEGANCLDALNKIYDLWNNIGWVYSYDSASDTHTITIGGADERTAANTVPDLTYGKGNGLNTVEAALPNKDRLATRLYVYGSNRNMVLRYYNNLSADIKDKESIDIQNLMLPVEPIAAMNWEGWGKTGGKYDAAKAYIDADAATIAKYGLLEKSVYFDGGEQDEIFPSIKGMTAGELRNIIPAGAAYRPTSIYADDERVDLVKACTNPAGSGETSGENGAKYGATYTVTIPAHQDAIAYQTPLDSPAVTLISDLAVAMGGKVAIPMLRNGRILTSDTPDEFRAQLVAYNGDTILYQTEVVAVKQGAYYFFVIDEIELTTSAAISLTLRLESIWAYTDGNRVMYEGEFLCPQQIFSIGVSGNMPKTFSLTLKQIGFNIDAQAALGEGKATIVMTSGLCNGRSFLVKDVAYQDATDDWLLTVWRQADDSIGMWYPNTTFTIEPGDSFALLDIAMPDVYVGAAAQKLLTKGRELLAKMSKPRPLFSPQVDAIVVDAKQAALGTPLAILREGRYMHIADEDIENFGADYVLIDTVTISEGEAEIPTYKVTIREGKSVTIRESFSATSEDRSTSAKNVATSEGQSTIGISSVVGLRDELDNKVNIPYWQRIFTPLDADGNEVAPNDTTTAIASVRVNYGLWSVSYITAHGINGSGGGGSIDLDRVWESLTNNTDKPDVLINPAHYLNNYLSGVSGSGNGTVTFARNGLASLTWDASHTHTIAQVSGLQSALDAKMDDWDVTLDGSVLTVNGVSIDLATASGVEALANAIAGNSARLYSIEDWFTHPALEELTVHTLNVEDVINGRIDWGNVLNTPTTLSGYGITDAVPSSRKVNGHALTSDVTVTKSDVGLGNVENTALSTWGGSTNITTLGTITSGTWHGEKIANDYLVNKTIGVGGATITLGGSATLSQIGVAQWAQTQDAAIAYSALPNLYIGMTRVQASSVAQALTGITTISASGLATILGGISLGGTYDDADSKLVWDAAHSAWHLIGNLYADGFITAGGINGSGGGSSVDLARVWESLTNNTDYPDVLINAAHIPVTLAGTTLTVGGTSIDIATATDLSAYVNAAGYNSASKQIELKHGTTVVATVDATEFIKDGMVSNVVISGGYLIISFNTDAGKEDIRIPLDDIFDADNYYTKSESDSRFFLASNFTQSNIQSTLGISAWAMAASKPSYTFSEIGSTPTTLSGYGITDAHITNGVITLGGNTITPLTQHQSLADYYTKAEVNAQVLPLSQGVADAAARIASIEDWFLMPSLEELLVRDLNVENAINADLAGNADTATILRTARTINSTSFDGSADIVTATWGTARNISISDADATNTGDAVSVNGGAAATLKLPSTIKAALSGNASSASRLAGTGTFSAWGRTFWQNGVPQSVSGAIENATTINASDAITLSGSTNTARRIYFGDSEHYLELDSYGFHFSHGVYSDDFVTAHGIGSGGGGGGGLIETLYRYADLGGTFSDSANDTFNAYTINKINADLSARIASLEGGSAMSIVTEGSGNVVSAVSKSGTVVTVTKGITALTEHQSLDALALKTTTITGTGYLTGGGSLAANRTIDIADAYKTQIGEGHTAYGWGNHADAGYALASDVYSASATRAANTVLAAPNGSNGSASFRALVAADIPSLTTGKISDIETWIAAKGYSTTTGTVTSVALSAPTGFAVSGSPVTSTGTLALSFASGYSLPTTAKQGQWDTAYGWGNHASAGYLKGIDSEMIENALGYIPMNEEDAYTKTMADMQVLALSEGISANDARLRSIEDWFAAPALEELFVTDLNVENTINGRIEWGNILNKSITLTGHITGTGGNTIATTIGAGVVTNAMLAGSIANSKLVNSTITLAGMAVSLGGSFSVDQMQDATGIIALAEGVAANSARIKSIEEWLESPSLEELFVTDLNVANTINGNAATATTLQTTRTIWGQSFNGSANVSGAISGITTLSASGLATIAGGIALGTSAAAQAATLVWDSTNNAWHLQGNFYADGFITAGGINGGGTTSGITGQMNQETGETFANTVGLYDALNDEYFTVPSADSAGFFATSNILAVKSDIEALEARIATLESYILPAEEA